MRDSITLVKVQFGSHLYGTSTPASDQDFKSVILPSGKDILLQQAKSVVSRKTKSDTTQKNSADDVDEEFFALQKFFKMVSSGDTMGLEVLFAPEWAQLEKHWYWTFFIERQRPHLVNKMCKGFVSYCQRQAAKYGIKGSRVAAVRAARKLLDDFSIVSDGTSKLSSIWQQITWFCEGQEHAKIVYIPGPNGVEIPHWEVCDRKLPYNLKIKDAGLILDSVLKNYGERALQAESNQGVDWKAVSHAVRVSRQAIELLGTGNLTFPRPDAEELLAIKLGRFDYKQIAGTLEDLLVQVEEASVKSTLPETSNEGYMERVLLTLHRRQVSGE